MELKKSAFSGSGQCSRINAAIWCLENVTIFNSLDTRICKGKLRYVTPTHAFNLSKEV